MDDDISGDEIAAYVLDEFAKWPSKRKPLNRGEGVKEWVPLAGIVAQVNGRIVCLAAATGMKCLPSSKIPLACGTTLHDWHAEILAIRSFNRFLLEECLLIAQSTNRESEYISFRNPDERSARHSQPFALKKGIKLHMYCSEAPCGDASMELTMSLQSDSTPWEAPPPLSEPTLQGRSYFSALGLIRRKPSRPDAPPTLSKSCSDKLALKQSTSLLSSITSLLISPENIYLASLVLPENQHSSIACARSFHSSGRLSPLKNINNFKWEGGYAFNPFAIKITEKEFQYSRRQYLKPGETMVPSNIASFSIPNENGTLIGGTLQGKKQFSAKGASPMCKVRMWKLCLEITKSVDANEIEATLRYKTFLSLKSSELFRDRKNVKRDVRTVLGGENGESGWVRNLGGEDFPLSKGIEA